MRDFFIGLLLGSIAFVNLLGCTEAVYRQASLDEVGTPNTLLQVIAFPGSFIGSLFITPFDKERQ